MIDPSDTAVPLHGPATEPKSGEPSGDELKSGEPSRRVVRLRPKTGKRLFGGAPWAYANEIVLDRRTKGLSPGSIVALEDADRVPLGTAAFNPASKIAIRLLDRDPTAEIGARWITERLRRALRLRERLFDAPYYRLIHAEADGLPGLIIDRFGEVVVVQPNAAWLDPVRPALCEAVREVLAPNALVLNGTARGRALDGLAEETDLAWGTEADTTVTVPMNGALYRADLLHGQKTGLFFDQRPNHAMAARLASGGRILDVFAHVGGFGLAALAAGASQAVLVDGSASALALAREGAEAMGVADRVETVKGDAFAAMRSLHSDGARFETVVCDPPAFAPTRDALEAGRRGYAKTARLGVSLTAPEGVFVLCSCSHAMAMEELAATAATAIRQAGRDGRLLHSGGAGADHPVHPFLPETRYLKALFYALD
ncbi:MAG: class I SAM-dependent rRNA methyltransferase [Pseudomonadota bacterium]